MQISALHTKTTFSAVSPRSTRAVAGIVAALTLFVAAWSLPTAAQTGGAYKVTNLISDGSVPAAFTDADFINPWAISVSGTWWISTPGSGHNFVVASAPTPGTIRFKVIVPAASGLTTAMGSPSGSVTTAGATGLLLPNGAKASFLFSTLDGTISGWNGLLGTSNPIAEVAINNSSAGASYTGLAIINTATASYVLAPNFGTGNSIEVYDGSFKPTKLAGTFTDPNLPPGYAPFSVHVLNNQVFVAYALRSSSAPYRTVDALGNGAVSVFDTSGNFIGRIATGGNLDSPWGVALAPTNFGIFGGSLLIGNFGNGLINAYDPVSFAYRGQLTDGTGAPLSYATLWELLPGGTTVGNTAAVSGGDTSTVYFTAGLAGEAHGLFAAIANDTTTAGTPAFGVSAAAGALAVSNGGAAVSTLISVAPTYGFKGAVLLACNGLPQGASCLFDQPLISPNGTAPVTTLLTIRTFQSVARLQTTRHNVAGVASALLFPLASFLAFYRRRSRAFNAFRMLVLCGVMIAPLGMLMSCGSSTLSTGNSQSTPTGTSQVVVTGTSGSISKSTTISLTVQ
jgi:uncharacterized protein (TIGR03118 family)